MNAIRRILKSSLSRPCSLASTEVVGESYFVHVRLLRIIQCKNEKIKEQINLHHIHGSLILNEEKVNIFTCLPYKPLAKLDQNLKCALNLPVYQGIYTWELQL